MRADASTTPAAGAAAPGRVELPGLRRALEILRHPNAGLVPPDGGCPSQADRVANVADEIEELIAGVEDRSPFDPPAAAAGTGAGAVAADLVAYLHRQWAWSKETFGPARRTKGVVQHIRKELVEIEADPHDLSEWVDVIILAMDGFWRHGGAPEDLLPRMQAKQDKNFARTWPDWRTMREDQAIEHDRSGEAAPPPGDPAPAGDAGALVDELIGAADMAGYHSGREASTEEDERWWRVRRSAARAALLSAIADRDREIAALRRALPGRGGGPGAPRGGGVSDELRRLSEAARPGQAEFKIVPQHYPESDDADLPGQIQVDGRFLADVPENYKPGIDYEADGAFLAAAWNDLRARIEAEDRAARARGGEG